MVTSFLLVSHAYIHLSSQLGSSADPASLGIPALLLSFSDNEDCYLAATQHQLKHLLEITPRLPNGAISHRTAITSAWADFVYMVPPFLAYYGAYTEDLEMVREAVEQCRLYRDILGTEKGLWKHIVTVGERATGEREEDDAGLWSTSNGWAAAGMTRVLAAISGSGFDVEVREEQRLLAEMIEEIVHGAMVADTDDSGLLRNYIDDESWFGEVAGTALLAANAFRMAVLAPTIFDAPYTDWALRKMEAVGRCVDVKTGIAAPLVNPLKESQRTPLSGPSPEGQAFVVLMYAAWRDWKNETVGSG
jgi:rhamnogalacturonyl hydrolase YesR